MNGDATWPHYDLYTQLYRFYLFSIGVNYIIRN